MTKARASWLTGNITKEKQAYAILNQRWQTLDSLLLPFYLDSQSIRLIIGLARKSFGNIMGNRGDQEPLKKLAQTFESLDLDKRIAAAKWLEGVIVAQALTPDEKESIIKASNEYAEILTEEEFVDKVNALIEYLQEVQGSSKSQPKTKRGKRQPSRSLRKNPP